MNIDDSVDELMNRLTPSDRMLITSLFWDTAKKIIVDNAPRDLSENELKRYVYEKMYDEPPPVDLWR